MAAKVLEGRALLDSVYEKMRQENRFNEAMDGLFHGLRELRGSMSSNDWRVFSSECLVHPLKELVHQDPFTFRGFSKPRGYAGDAVLIDFIYRDDSIQDQLDNMSNIGMKVFEYTNAAPAACAIRERRDLIARKIDEVSSQVDSPHILSLACGHLNEAKHTEAVRENRIGRFVAFDQDMDSLEVVKRTYNGNGCIECVHGSIVDLIKNKIDLGTFHLVYALGLFDYLTHPIARRLTKNMVGMLKPGGRLIIGNFVPDIKDVGYMESFMDWKLINRSKDEMETLVAGIETPNAENVIYYETNKNIVFLEICKE